MYTIRFDFKDLGYTVVLKPREYHTEFTIYDIEGEDMRGNPMWHKKGSTCGPDPVSSIEDADVYLHGDVKWDGCSNWHFDEQDRVMLHFCTREGMIKLGEVMARCWDMAMEKAYPTSP